MKHTRRSWTGSITSRLQRPDRGLIAGTRGNIVAGGGWVEGDVLVHDGDNRQVIMLDGEKALGVAGAPGKAGHVEVKHDSGATTVKPPIPAQRET